ERFGMPPRYASKSLSRIAEIPVSAPECSPRSVLIFHDKLIWVLLVPLQRSLGSVGADGEIVLFTCGNLRRKQDTPSASLVVNKKIAIIFEAPSLNKSGEIGAEFLNLKPGYIAP